MRPSCAAPLARVAALLGLAWALCACGGVAQRGETRVPPPAPQLPSTELTDMTATLEMMQTLPEGDPARQAEIFESARNAASLAPTTSNQLRYALALATPGHAGSDPVAAQRQLSELLATPENLLPAERLLARVQLTDVDQRLVLQAENRQLREEAPRESRDKLAGLNRRMSAELDENGRLRKALEEAQAKLDAVTHIERSINDRGTAGSTTATPNGSHP